ncbi:MAG TPA: DUF4347 domain-containing protein, partial [Stellaceae bacterium]|nr:DUF4347 domain-containing protein [Stellaceae bacterium]
MASDSISLGVSPGKNPRPSGRPTADRRAGGASRRVPADELAFIDPGVPELPLLLRGLRRRVVPIVLSDNVPAIRQIAATLAGRRGVDVVHVIAHGAPGLVTFGCGEWSLAALAEDPETFAAIGRELAADGTLCLWSCRTGAGNDGVRFVAGLAAATAARVAASADLVGAAAHGGRWLLTTDTGNDAPPPLTVAGIAAYSELLTAYTWKTASNGAWTSASNWSDTSGTFPGAASSDTATIAVAGGYTITLDQSEAFKTLTLRASGATLAMGANSLTLTSAAISAGTVSLSGGTLSAGTSIVVSSGATVIGFGALTGPLSGGGVIEASGGVLDINGNITATNVTGLAVANGGSAVLEIGGSVAAGAKVTFLGGAGEIELTGSTISASE